MTEHKRLTTKEKYPHGAEGVSKDKLTGKYCRGVFEATACVEKLAEYETAEEEGRLVVLPCKVGDVVYVIAPNHRLCETKHDCDEYDYENYLPSWCEKYCPYGYKGIGVIKDTVSHIEIRNNGICYCTTNCGYLYEDKVFLTRKEAEKALKERVTGSGGKAI